MCSGSAADCFCKNPAQYHPPHSGLQSQNGHRIFIPVTMSDWYNESLRPRHLGTPTTVSCKPSQNSAFTSSDLPTCGTYTKYCHKVKTILKFHKDFMDTSMVEIWTRVAMNGKTEIHTAVLLIQDKNYIIKILLDKYYYMFKRIII